MKYIFINAKKNHDEMKNSKENETMSANKWSSGEV